MTRYDTVELNNQKINFVSVLSLFTQNSKSTKSKLLLWKVFKLQTTLFHTWFFLLSDANVNYWYI